MRPPTVLRFRQLYELSTQVTRHEGATQRKLLNTMLDNTLGELSARLYKLSSTGDHILTSAQLASPAVARLGAFCKESSAQIEAARSALTPDTDVR